MYQDELPKKIHKNKILPSEAILIMDGNIIISGFYHIE